MHCYQGRFLPGADWVIKVRISKKAPDTKNISKVVVFDNLGRVLLLLRKRDQLFPRKWDLPGGHLVVGESWEDGARRETKEETNLDLGRLEIILDKGKNKYFKTKEWEGEIFEPHKLPEHDDYMWVDPEKMGDLDITKVYLSAIRSALT